MAGHIYCYAYGAIDNLQITFAKAQKWAFQPILSTAISVDTFFVLRFEYFIWSEFVFKIFQSLAVSCCHICSLKPKRRDPQRASHSHSSNQ